MVTLELKANGQEIKMSANYSYRNRLALIFGAYFDYDMKAWIAPISSLPQIESEFQGELYYKTPKWRLHGETRPPKQELTLYQLPAEEPELKIRMFDYQRHGFQYMVDRINQFGFVLNADGVGLGKCHGKGTEILMADGSIKKVEDIAVGERLMGDDGTGRTVLSLARGTELLYRVRLSNGDSFVCNESHILSLANEETGAVKDMSIQEYTSLKSTEKGLLKAYKRKVTHFENEPELRMDPYLLGRWIAGDTDARPHDPYGRTEAPYNGDKNHIPKDCKYGSEETRLAVLAGMFDFHGAFCGKNVEVFFYEALREEVRFLGRSLGFEVKEGKKGSVTGSLYLQGDLQRIPAMRIYAAYPFGLPKADLRYSFRVEPLGKGEYFGFQIDGNHRYLLADFTVTHNTIQSIATMKWFMEQRGAKKILIICKKSIKTQWESEIHKFTDLEVPIFVTRDSKKKRTAAYEGMRQCEEGILITNYHNYLNDTETIQEIGCDFCIIDEVHSLKTRNGVMHKGIAKVVSGKRTILLTGTPIMSKPDDIYGIISLVDEKYFRTYKEFCERYIVMEYGIYGYQMIGARNLDELQGRIQDIMVRRASYDVDLDLPKQLPPIAMLAEMDATQTRLMNYVQELKDGLDHKKAEILSKYDAEQARKGQIPLRIKDIIAEINERSKMYIATMQFIADDPACFIEMGAERGINKHLLPMIPKGYKMSPKTEMTLDKIEEIVSGGEKIVVFCHFATATKLLKEHLEKRFGDAGPYVVLYTGAQNDEQREKNVNAFKTDDNCAVFIATEAAAEGLNLQVTRHLMHYEQADTYAQRNQRIGRIRRIGSQYETIMVYDMLTAGSFDEVKRKKIERNKDLSDTLLDGKSE